jgi:hypothetical protein
VVYCLCCYEDKKVENLFVEKVINRYIKLLKESDIKTDFKIINFIPDEINDRLNTIQNFHKNTNNSNKTYYRRLINPKRAHHIKAWNTKFYLINQFFNSSYESMLYLDCDLHIRKIFSLNSRDELCFRIKPRLTKLRTYHPISVARAHLSDSTITKHIQAGSFYINKNYSFNLEEILNLNEIQKLWEKDSNFLREEAVFTYLFNKHNLIDKITDPPMKFRHIDTWENKLKYFRGVFYAKTKRIPL